MCAVVVWHRVHGCVDDTPLLARQLPASQWRLYRKSHRHTELYGRGNPPRAMPRGMYAANRGSGPGRSSARSVRYHSPDASTRFASRARHYPESMSGFFAVIDPSRRLLAESDIVRPLASLSSRGDRYAVWRNNESVMAVARF